MEESILNNWQKAMLLEDFLNKQEETGKLFQEFQALRKSFFRQLITRDEYISRMREIICQEIERRTAEFIPVLKATE